MRFHLYNTIVLLFFTTCLYSQADSSWNKFEMLPQPQKEFTVYKLRTNVYAIREFADFEDVNCYLITGSTGALLFDTGLGLGDIKTVVSKLTNLPLLVINSHTHYDHIAGNYLFDSIKVLHTAYTLYNAKGMQHNDFISFYKKAYLVDDISSVHIPDDYFIHPFSYVGFITDGEKIDLGGIVLEVITTPGHTPDAICLLDKKDRLLFSGDTIYKGTVFLHLSESDFTEYTLSVSKLRSLNNLFDLVLPAHNSTELKASCVSELYTDVMNIKRGKTSYNMKNGVRLYDDGFFKFLLK